MTEDSVKRGRGNVWPTVVSISREETLQKGPAGAEIRDIIKRRLTPNRARPVGLKAARRPYRLFQPAGS